MRTLAHADTNPANIVEMFVKHKKWTLCANAEKNQAVGKSDPLMHLRVGPFVSRRFRCHRCDTDRGKNAYVVVVVVRPEVVPRTSSGSKKCNCRALVVARVYLEI